MGMYIHALSDLSLHLVDFVSETIDGELTRDRILGSMCAYDHERLHVAVCLFGVMSILICSILFTPNNNSCPLLCVWHAGFILLGILRWMFECGEGLSCLGLIKTHQTCTV